MIESIGRVPLYDEEAEVVLYSDGSASIQFDECSREDVDISDSEMCGIIRKYLDIFKV